MQSTRDRPLLLGDETLSQLQALSLRTRASGHRLFTGPHRSAGFGASNEFYDHQPYVRGQPAQRIDWRAWARTDRLYVRRYRHEAQLDVAILLDRSASMRFSSLQSTQASGLADKWTIASQVATAIAFVALHYGDRFSLISFDDRIEPVIAPTSQWSNWYTMQQHLRNASCERRTDPHTLRLAVDHLHHRDRIHSGHIVVISDSLGDARSWLEHVAVLDRQRFSWTWIQLLSPDEMDIGGIGGARLVDMETGEALQVHGRQWAGAYRRAVQQQMDRLSRGLKHLGVHHTLHRTDQSVVGLMHQICVFSSAGGR